MKKKLTKSLLVLAALASTVFTSCGNPTTATTANNTQNTATETTTAAVAAKVKVTYDLNYSGAAAANVVEIEEDTKATEPADPTRAGYAFLGWSIDKNSAQIYDFNKIVGEDMTLYAAWGAEGSKKLKNYTFEAEYCPCITAGQGLTGSTYSGGTNGKGLIQEDYDNAADASNGFYVHFLYSRGNTLTFEIEAAEAVSNVAFYARLSAEYKSPVVINKDKYPVKVNSNAIVYNEITFADVPRQGELPLKFKDFKMGDIDLVKGTNKFDFVTDNDEMMMGTALSTAPMIDCIKLYSSETLTWPTANVSQIEGDE